MVEQKLIIQNLQSCFNCLQTMLKLECKNIKKGLEDYNKKMNLNWEISNIKIGLNTRMRKNKSINDYSNYVWLEIKVDDGNSYWITLFYNDVDPKSGNFHTQFGRVQFWKIYEKPRAVSGPNIKVGRKMWGFINCNSFDPKIWIDDKTYSIDKLIEKFENYVNEEKIIKRK